MHTCRRLVSTLHRNSIDHRRTTALASTRDTSAWEQSQARGQHDNLPVLTQSCRMSSVASLFYPGRKSFRSPYQEPNSQLGRAIREPSLPVGYIIPSVRNAWSDNRVP